MRMRRLGIGCMVVMIPMRVIMVVVMVPMMMIMLHLQPTHSSAEVAAQRTIDHIRARRIGPLTLNMMMVAFLDRADLRLKTQNCRAIFTHHTGGRRDRAKGRVLSVFWFDVMMVPAFEGQNLFTIAAKRAIWRRRLGDLFGNPLRERLQNMRMIPKISYL